MDTTTNPTNPAATAAFPKLRLRHAFSYGVCRGTESAVKMLDSAATVVEAVAIRVKLNNISVAADMIDELGKEKVTEAQALISNL